MENKLTSGVMKEFIEGLDAAAVLDEHGAYVYVSPGWERYTGILACDALGKKVWDLMPDTHAKEVYKTKKPLFARVVRKRGIPAFTSYFPRLGADGSVRGVFLYIMFQGMDSIQDMTSRIQELTNTIEYYRQELARERGAKYGGSFPN